MPVGHPNISKLLSDIIINFPVKEEKPVFVAFVKNISGFFLKSLYQLFRLLIV